MAADRISGELVGGGVGGVVVVVVDGGTGAISSTVVAVVLGSDTASRPIESNCLLVISLKGHKP